MVILKKALHISSGTHVGFSERIHIELNLIVTRQAKGIYVSYLDKTHWKHTHTHTHTHARAHARTHIHTHIHARTHTHIHAHTHTHTHTQTHTHTAINRLKNCCEFIYNHVHLADIMFLTLMFYIYSARARVRACVCVCYRAWTLCSLLMGFQGVNSV